MCILSSPPEKRWEEGESCAGCPRYVSKPLARQAGRGKEISAITLLLVERRVYHFPHTHGRLFPDHIRGVADILQQWNQPHEICMAGLFHSCYATEMFPWKLFSLTERSRLQETLGQEVEEIVFLYCTCSQNGIYRQVKSLMRRGQDIPAEGLVTNYYTGQQCYLPHKLAAKVLVVLGADLMEQDPFFDLYLSCACLKIASRHLQETPRLVSLLDRAGFFQKNEKEVREVSKAAKKALSEAFSSTRSASGQDELQARLTKLHRQAPWLFEGAVELSRLTDEALSDEER
ncbi:hypothetical protein GUITHDRAFT_112173 [Guillardia theta CCMP2712]|uniref:DUF6817 domain-containing protein n=1 Tax=Guillardia theta (strain CCMP2712) TaxID=905079 RepID=L1J0C1_GUITC|nr:hypothetical protein GUITHDRAFT_112173 [Guillardia theta CCMP2712]EKX41757.1 hypothetical protein GUITHDRAFT_112173 [Guillardia theta CCMP2712]|eukprot:XP_005828737.1 hypothetical protein GUITHDRAFT_112173 [Guillardia theta CCMP2712]